VTVEIDPHAECESKAWKPVHCERCGRDFVCCPWDDFYCAAEGDHCCERCLIGDRKLIVVDPARLS
jgi:hypothetical protein